ncbi:MAG TPA: helix-turn-helix domain-containing protein [Acidimicrobiales bacterium]|nr:helix-turn-helix domain-containing protein [Acidimicrobiales bacterium]
MTDATRPLRASANTGRRVVDAAMVAFAHRGYEATSLDALAVELGVRKQTILYHFSSKDALLDAVIDEAGRSLVNTLEDALASPGPGLARVDSVVRSVFRLAARRPELLGLLREVSRLGPPPATRLRRRLEPFIDRATAFLEVEMASGSVRRQDARLLILAAYSTVIGVATEVEVLRALGLEPTARSLVQRRRELLEFLHSALASEGVAGGPEGVVGERRPA